MGEDVKGVILAGGQGTRLSPLTLVTNKHLLPVYDRPMIHYPIGCLVEAGIREILLVTGGEHAGDFLKLLGNGRGLGVSDLHYTHQDGHGGIADALSLAEDFADGQRICVMLGDNILEHGIGGSVAAFDSQPSGARIHLSRVQNPSRFGVPRFEQDDSSRRIVQIIEKPSDPPSDYAVTGIYMYDADVFDMSRDLQPSARGELEITDVNNRYLERGDLTHAILDGWWADGGTFDSLLRVGQLVAKQRKASP